jgi:hypothetical protein
MTMKNTMIRPCAVISTFHRWSCWSKLGSRPGSWRRPEILDARLRQFGAHDARHGAADDAREDREDQVERADVLVVGGHEPASEEARLVIVIVRIVVMMRIEPFVVCGMVAMTVYPFPELRGRRRGSVGSGSGRIRGGSGGGRSGGRRRFLRTDGAALSLHPGFELRPVTASTTIGM